MKTMHVKKFLTTIVETNEINFYADFSSFCRSKSAVNWLKVLVTTHAAHLLAHPEIGDSLGPILGLIDSKLSILSELSRLRGRVSLVTGQISRSHEEQSKDITEESLLVYQDPG